jgi:hypothetical protein
LNGPRSPSPIETDFPHSKQAVIFAKPGNAFTFPQCGHISMHTSRERTRAKNRIHGTLARHNVAVPGADLFGAEGRLELSKRLPELPVHSREPVEQELATLDFLQDEIRSAESG